MTAADYVTLIAAVAAALALVIGTVFAGILSLRQVPQVHRLVNSANTALKDEITALRAEIRAKDAATLDHDLSAISTGLKDALALDATATARSDPSA